MKKPHTTPTNVETLLKQGDFIVSKTNTKGIITYCNRIFMNMAGYDEDELIGVNHNIIRHPDMPRVAFKLLWDTVQKGEEFFAFVKNLRKDGGFYWVFTHIVADFDSNGNIVGYTSVRRIANRNAIEAVTPLYAQMVQAERSGGMEASGKILFDFLDSNNIEYTQLILSLQGGN